MDRIYFGISQRPGDVIALRRVTPELIQFGWTESSFVKPDYTPVGHKTTGFIFIHDVRCLAFNLPENIIFAEEIENGDLLNAGLSKQYRQFLKLIVICSL